MAITQISAKYDLIGPDGTVVSFNDPNDTNYIGMLTDVSGLDSPEVRESADSLVQQDGGIHGDFFYDRRPIVLTGILLNPASTAQSNQRQSKLSRASNAMRADATLMWNVDGNPWGQQVKVRRQQPLRISGAWQKEFQLSLVAADPRIYGWELGSASTTTQQVSSPAGRVYDRTFDQGYGVASPAGQLLAFNAGDTTTYPLVTITGPGVNPSVTNATTGQTVAFFYTLGDGDKLTIDMLNHTVMLNGSFSRYSAVDFNTSNFWGLIPGFNDIRIVFSSSFAVGQTLRLDYRFAWL